MFIHTTTISTAIQNTASELRYNATITIICNDTELTNQIIAGIDPSPFLAGDVL